MGQLSWRQQDTAAGGRLRCDLAPVAGSVCAGASGHVAVPCPGRKLLPCKRVERPSSQQGDAPVFMQHLCPRVPRASCTGREGRGARSRALHAEGAVLCCGCVFLIPVCTLDTQPAYTCSVAAIKLEFSKTPGPSPCPQTAAAQSTLLSPSPSTRGISTLREATKSDKQQYKLQHPAALIHLLLPQMWAVPLCPTTCAW